MKTVSSKAKIGIYILGGFLTVFGIVTLKEGGGVLFFDPEARAAAGNFVPFVLWSNFLSGFFYVTTGLGILFRRSWAPRFAVGLAGFSAVVLAALIVHILLGGLYEPRTLVAMALRTTIWAGSAYILLKKLKVVF